MHICFLHWLGKTPITYFWVEEQWDNLFYIKLSVYVREKKKKKRNKSQFQKEKSSRFWKRTLVFDVPGSLKYVIYESVALKEFLQLIVTAYISTKMLIFFSYCYGLDCAATPLKCICWIPNPPMWWHLEVGPLLCETIRFWWAYCGWSSHDGIIVLIRRATREHPLCHVKTQKGGVCLQARKRALNGDPDALAPWSWTYPPELWKINSYCLSHVACGALCGSLSYDTLKTVLVTFFSCLLPYNELLQNISGLKTNCYFLSFCSSGIQRQFSWVILA